MEIEAVSINVFLMQCSKCEMSDKRLLAKLPPYKKVRNEREDILNVHVVGSDTVIEANDSAHSPIERCQVVNAAETVTSASELNNGEEELRVDTETADDDAIKDDRPWGGRYSVDRVGHPKFWLDLAPPIICLYVR